MKKYALLALIAFQVQAELPPEFPEHMRKHIEEQGSSPDGGVIIVPRTKLLVSKNLQSEWAKQTQEQKSKGYYTEETDRPKELLQMHDTIRPTFQSSDKDHNPSSSHLRRTIAEIKMAYDYIPVPSSEITQHLGFAASGGYSNGWNGVVEFFDKENLGSCAYTENNVKLSHVSAQIAKESVQYAVNGKVTTIEVKGSKTSGYLYTVEWFDSDFFKTLECANMNYSIETTQNVIALAKRIDMK